MGDVIKISPTKLVFPPDNYALRPPPSPQDEDWESVTLVLKDDLSANGISDIFSVSETPDGNYMVLNGSRRAACAIMLCEEGHSNFQEIYVQVGNQQEYDALERQIAGNATIKKTPNTQYIKALQRLLIAKNYSIAELSKKVAMSEAYLTNLLKLNHLPEYAKEALDNGNMTVTNAIQLNKLPEEEIADFLPNATTMSGQDFTTAVSEKLNAIAKDKRAERTGEKKEFSPSAKYLKKGDAELKFEQAKQQYETEESDFNRGYLLAWQEIFCLDEVSVAEQKASYEQKIKESEEKKAERAKKRESEKTAAAVELLKKHGVNIDTSKLNITIEQ